MDRIMRADTACRVNLMKDKAEQAMFIPRIDNN